jgi:hypothetical protein
MQLPEQQSLPLMQLDQMPVGVQHLPSGRRRLRST